MGLKKVAGELCHVSRHLGSQDGEQEWEKRQRGYLVIHSMVFTGSPSGSSRPRDMRLVSYSNVD